MWVNEGPNASFFSIKFDETESKPKIESMPLMQCEKHGWHSAELATESVHNHIEKDNFDSGEIVLLDLIWDEIEFPIVALRLELPLLNTTLIDGSLHVVQEEEFNEILGGLKPMCAECLKAHLRR
jgi:hypothetical protein